MGKRVNAISGVILYLNLIAGPALADTVALALPAPRPAFDAALPELPNVHPARLTHKTAPLNHPARPNLSTRVAEQADISAFGFACGAEVSVEGTKNAMIELSIKAPCKPDQIATVQYSDLSFDQALSMTGEAQLTLPALGDQDILRVTFEDGQSLQSHVKTPEIDAFARVAISWDGPVPPRLNGTAPRHLPIEITRLGDGSGRVLQVLSHHLDPDEKSGVIRLGMLTEVTSKNCGHTQAGKVVQQTPGLPQLRYALKLAAAGCDQIGRNLELKNILQDLKLASN